MAFARTYSFKFEFRVIRRELLLLALAFVGGSLMSRVLVMWATEAVRNCRDFALQKGNDQRLVLENRSGMHAALGKIQFVL
jgi:hypothetical protein